MSRLSELRQHGSFPGALVNVLEEFDQRLAALEVYGPMFADLGAEYRAHLEREAARAALEAPAAETGPAGGETKPATDETGGPQA